AMALRTLQSKA
ncbi:chlamydia polymorphic membrane middle domain protein, partial [Chlamydia ibidis]